MTIRNPYAVIMQYPGDDRLEENRVKFFATLDDAVAFRDRQGDAWLKVFRVDPADSDLLAILDNARERMRAAEATARQLTADLDAIGGMKVIEHEGHRLRVITVALHDRLCKARVGTPQGTTPQVLHCALCGYCYPPLDTTNDQPEGGSRG